MTAHFYRAFEDKHRGTRELIKQRLQVYLPFIRPLAEQHPLLPVVDLGCGRGEWLELLQQHGITASGVDLDENMLAACRERGLNVTNGDAIAHLEALGEHSALAVTGFHIAEHLPFAALQAVFAQARRVLVAHGLLILETPNPENLVVGTSSFYIDPTHERPLPSQLLVFLAEHQGFDRVQLLRLQEDAHLAGAGPVSLYDVLGGVSPDYAIVASTSTDSGRTDPATPGLAVECGVSLHALASRYDQHLQARSDTQLRAIAEARLLAEAAQNAADAARATAEQLGENARALGARAEQFATELSAMHASSSWRITRPLRWLSRLFRSGSRPG